MIPPTAIRTERLTKWYGPALGIRNLDLTVAEGEVFGFLGPNGAGKTTTIRLLLDLIRPTAGHAWIFGQEVQAASVAVRRLVGYLPGELALWPGLTGKQTLAYLGNLRGGVDAAFVTDLAARLGLDLSKKFRDYSRGNKQKVGLIQAFMHRPRLLILDEPTSGLDPLNQQEFYRMLAEARAGGATVFLSSHILSEVEHTSDRVGIVRAGQLVRVAAIADVVAEKRQQIALTLSAPPDPDALAALRAVPGVSNVVAAGNGIQFAVQGDLAGAIRWAGGQPLLTLTSHEPTLEEAFLDYYREPEPAHA
ncbi:MAG: ABC transporter ATP-binding protein [Chloroflexota bacterium]|nr:ABC transporter ATP-binding protein [Chloroflexota bacterium]